MARTLRFIPEGGALVEVTTRTIQNRFLLTPSRTFNEVVLGVMGRAQRLHPLELVAAVCLSTHYHLLAWVEDAEQLSQFMFYFNGQLSREIGRLHDWPGPTWSRRYQAIVVSDEEAAQVDRLRYVLSHGVKENLVEKVSQWPGVHAGPALAEGRSLEGTWFDRTQEFWARRRGESFDKYEYATEETVTFSSLPCWRHVAPEVYQQRILEIIEDVEAEAATERRHNEKPVLGVAAVLARDPHGRPNIPKKSPAPAFHAVTREAHRALRQAYSWFYAAFRDAAEKLKTGDRDAEFPEGSFPPGLPYVRGSPIREPPGATAVTAE